MTTPTSGRAPRRDAQRNRAHIVEAAEGIFGAEGLEASMDAIAKGAGVGAGTLYRHFPTREDLVAAVIEGRRPDLERERIAISDSGLEPQAALERWLTALATWMRVYDGLAEPLRAAAAAQSTPLGATCDDVIATTDRFLAAVQDAGQARPGVRGRDLFLGALAAAWAAGATPDDDADSDTRLLDLLRSGWAVG